MKNRFLHLTLLGLLLFNLTAFSQSVGFGIKAGVTHSGLKGDAVSTLNNLTDYTNGIITPKYSTGFFAGGFASIPLTNNFSIEPGLQYSQKGYALQGNLNISNLEFLGMKTKANLDMNYIELPLLAKYTVSGLEIFAGPQISYLTNASLVSKAGLLGINLLNNKMDISDQFNRWDAGISAGVGYGFTNGLSLSAAYDHGLSNIDANKNIHAQNRAYKIGIGYRF